MKKKISLLIVFAIAVIGGVLGYSKYVESSVRKNADTIMYNINDLNLTYIYDNLDESVKDKYKTKDEFVEKFPLSDFMNPTNKGVFLNRSVTKGKASYSYFLPNQDKVDEGVRITIAIPYSAFNKKILDVSVQDDTAPIQ